MRTPFKKAVLAVATIALLTTACNKKEAPITETGTDPKPTEQPKEVNATTLPGTYVVTKVEGQSGTQRSDITSSWFSSYAGECAKDDITQFRPDGSFVVLDGSYACDESTDDTGTWSVIDQTRLKIDTDTAVIEAFNEAMLRIVSPVYSTPQGKVIFTYTRK
jgi:hypothetical protein